MKKSLASSASAVRETAAKSTLSLADFATLLSPAAGESLDALNMFRSPAQQRLIFEEFYLYQLSLALDRKATRKENAIAFRLREDNGP